LLNSDFNTEASIRDFSDQESLLQRCPDFIFDAVTSTPLPGSGGDQFLAIDWKLSVRGRLLRVKLLKTRMSPWSLRYRGQTNYTFWPADGPLPAAFQVDDIELSMHPYLVLDYSEPGRNSHDFLNLLPICEFLYTTSCPQGVRILVGLALAPSVDAGDPTQACLRRVGLFTVPASTSYFDGIDMQQITLV
jgi:hypothetical protein